MPTQQSAAPAVSPAPPGAAGQLPAVRLDDLAVLEFSGADAATFLQGQLTNDVLSLPPDRARLAGYCTAKGRLLATLVLWRKPAADGNEGFLALVKADIAEALAKRLTMFVLRAKVGIQVSSRPVLGMPACAAPLPPNAGDWMLARDASGVWICAPHGRPAAHGDADPQAQRCWHVPAQDASPTTGQAFDLPAPDCDALSAWQAQDIAVGLPWICAANQDVHIPQTLNLELIDGVSFTKGCYPGQEVVARSHYRGTIKRRTARGFVAGLETAAPGTDIFDARRPDGPCGRVVNAANGNDGLHLLLEVQLADIGVADFRLAHADGPVVALRDLPYAIKAE